MRRLGVFNRGLRRLPTLAALLDCEVVAVPWGANPALDGALGWGLRKYARRARRASARRGIPFYCLEDGFLRSVGLGKSDPPLSLVVDDQGIHYDATARSRLEQLVLQPRDDNERSRARALIGAWRAARVSKYNHSRDYEGSLPERFVLVVDQTFGDASIRFGMADESSFSRMLEAALAENPEAVILVKIHPEVMAGRKQGHFDLTSLARNSRIRVLGEDVHPVSLIEKAGAIYVVTSQMGFEGLLWGKPVRTFGMPFYAGWGLTRDELPAPTRRGQASLEQLVHAALVDYPRYIDPESGQRCEPERLIEWMAVQRETRERFPPLIYAFGFSRWKRGILRDFLQGSEVRFVRRIEQVPVGGTLAVWGRKINIPAARGDIRALRIEDGFLRSVGLGADLVRPLSWVIDASGIYYDCTVGSDLESMLQETVFDDGLGERAGRLRERIVAAGLTKYNIGARGWMRPDGAGRVILVPGQVESDASIRYGTGEIRTNMALLRAVREANPEAWIVYKPHPDVLAGLRAQGSREGEAASWCDEVVTDVAMGEILPQVDEVHVLTSLTGFEALLRGKAVTCYGHPFYAGWGLTTDISPIARRTRRVSLDELVAAVLILYPVYVSRSTGRYTTPERALDELLAWREQGASSLPRWRKGLRWMLQGWARLRGV